MDLLGVIIMLFRDINDIDASNVYWIEVAQYLISLIYFTKDKVRESLAILDDMVINKVKVPNLISYHKVVDHVCWLPMHIHPTLLMLETARLKHRLGHEELSFNLFKEIWSYLFNKKLLKENTEAANLNVQTNMMELDNDIMNSSNIKSSPVFERMNSSPIGINSKLNMMSRMDSAVFHDYPSPVKSSKSPSPAVSPTKKAGKAVEQEEDYLFLLYDTTSFDQWINNHEIFFKIATMYRKQYYNLFMAAEFYAMAAEIIAGNCSIGEAKSVTFEAPKVDINKRPVTPVNGLVTNRSNGLRWEDLTLELRELSVYYLLDRADCLSELGMHKKAEDCAHFCYSLLPLDVVVLGRASRMILPSRRNIGINKTIVEAADRIFRRVRLVTVSIYNHYYVANYQF